MDNCQYLLHFYSILNSFRYLIYVNFTLSHLYTAIVLRELQFIEPIDMIVLEPLMCFFLIQFILLIY